jgi:transcriptional regulator with XRE-family HTH domain
MPSNPTPTPKPPPASPRATPAARRLRAARLRSGVARRELAARVGCSARRLVHLERGIGPPDPLLLLCAREALDALTGALLA